jgi:acyl-coenzyme A synthetase/AMP-(fatty) acid ligase
MENFNSFYENISTYQNEEAIVDNDKTYTYNQLLERVEYYDNFLKENNVSSNSLVSVFSKTGFESISLFLSLCKNKITVIPISYISKNKKQKFQEIATADYEISFNNNHPQIRNINTLDNRHEYYKTIAKRDSSGLVVFSSGSTGKNKAAIHDLNFIFEKFNKKRRKMRIISFLLFDHLGGINTFLYTLSNGGCLIIPKNRTAESVLKSIQDYKADLLPTSPSFINMLLVSNKIQEYDLSSLSMVSYGTELMHEHTLVGFRRALPHVELLQTYGLTEIGVLRSKSLNSDSLWVKLGGAEFKTRVVNNKLEIKGNSTMLGYLNHDNPFTEDGWLITGDNVETNGEYFKILGRDSDIINVGGQKVYPAEVENVLLTIDNIADASVYSEKNDFLGQIVCANIVVTIEENRKEITRKIKKECLKTLEKYKIPMKIKLVNKIQNSRFKRMRSSFNEH